MSRDARRRPEADNADDADAADRLAELGETPGRRALLTAYLDGVAELAPDERHGVEAWLASDPDARAEADAVHGLLGELRALPASERAGDEPDWAAMERSIRQAVAQDRRPPWWRAWRWLAPAMACASAAAALLVLGPSAGRRPAGSPDLRAAATATATAPSPAPAQAAEAAMLALWLDDGEVEVDLSAPGVPDRIEAALGEAPAALAAVDASLANEPSPAEPTALLEPGERPESPEDEVGLLPATGLAWIDHLDDAALDRAERWLGDQPRPASPGGSPRAPERKKS